MIQRFTYVNSLNVLRSAVVPHCQHLHREVTMNTTFYLKKRYMFITKVRRRAWLRRKSKFEYMTYFNLLAYWASDYRFARKQTSFTFNYRLSKATSVIQNLSFLRNEYPALGFDSEYVYSAPITKISLAYIGRQGYNKSAFWLKNHSSLQTFASFFNYKELERIDKQIYAENFMIKGCSYAQNVLYDASDFDDINLTHVLDSLFSTLFYLYLQVLLEIYKLFNTAMLFMTTDLLSTTARLK